MKTLFTLVAATLLAWVAGTPAIAAPPAPPAGATFVSERGQVFGLALDGQPLTRPVARQVRVARLVPGQHWADFSVPTRYGPPLRFRTAVWLQPGLETNYVLVLRPGYGPQLRQLGAVPLGRPVYGPQGSYPGSYPQGYPAPQQGPAPYNTPGNYDEDNDYSPPAGPPYGNDPRNGGSYGNNGAPAPGYPGGYNPGGAPSAPNGNYYPGSAAGSYLQPLAPAEVADLTQALRNRSFDDARLPIVKQALAQSAVRADELAQLISTLSFDKSRIELAEYGYAHLSDPQNFYRVYDVLRYPTSIREVQQALGLPQN
ncbi:DUF4476 domain-containing protein [Hymenobacter setariae]|uniref:DUF4476 domain-containing protein n=1 Tax=Hymenobacter setariae TaxID=2594794 RepID=A0A558BUB1_9BACT|nr:DUF4476 domain-containing protein [Hymenobacter setariae]TVT40101.1 DUF4476 domain-containing protein [Hymenobacter setariae]